MVETIFPSSSNWYFSKILSTREDGSIAYGSQNNIFVLRVSDNQIFPFIITDAHKDRVTSVVFSPSNKSDEAQNLVLSSSCDGFVKIWNISSQRPTIGHNSHCVAKEVVKVVCATWSPCNAQYVVSAAENDSLVLWNTFDNTTTKFIFPKLKPSVIQSSYHNEKILGVGSKSGMVFIVKLVGKGEIIHRLRGHDKEVQGLSWNPIPHVAGESNFENCLLASSCQENEIFIWQAETGKCVTKINLPNNSLSKEEHQHGKPDLALIFIPLFWASPNHLYSGTKFGELVCCDPTLLIRSEKKNVMWKNKKKVVSDNWRFVHAFHKNAIFAIAAVPMIIKNEDFNRVDYGPNKDPSNLEISSNKSNLNINLCNTNNSHFSSNDAENPESGTVPLPMQGLIWTFGKDQKLVAISENSPEDPVYFFHTINGHAFVFGVSPFSPNIVAIGAGDGKIRLWNISRASGHVRVFKQKINDRVYSLAWHPCDESLLAFGTSEGRVGLIDMYSQKSSANFLNTHPGKVYCLSWGPTFSEDEPGCSSGRKNMSLYSVGGHKILFHNPTNLGSETLNIHSNVPCKNFVDLSWKPDFTILALGSRKGYIYILSTPKFEIVHTVLATTKCVMSLTWHPTATNIDFDCHTFQGYLTFASIDNENVIKVYNCTKVNDLHRMDQVSVLKGHSGHVQFVSWSPHIGGRLLSSSADYSLRIWDVTTSTQLIKIVASQSILPLFCLWSPIDSNVIITGYNERVVISWRISKSSLQDPILKSLKLEKGNTIQIGELLNSAETLPAENNNAVKENSQSFMDDTNKLTLAKRNEDQKSVKENKMCTKAWKSDADSFQNCYELLTIDKTESVPSYKLSFLKSGKDFVDYLKVEDESYKVSNNWSLRYQLALWRGNLNEVLQEHINSGHLDDYLVSLAPFVSPRLWQQACASYSKTLAEKKYYRKAATYLLAIHKIYEAIELLESADLYLEAICVARCRLPEANPVFLNLIRKYADWLTDTGNVLKASECFIYLNDYSEAVRVLAKKNQPEHLSLAALASKKAGLGDLESEYSYRALVLCLESEKLALASRICSDHSSIKKLSVLYETHQVISKLESEQLTLEKDLVTHLKELTGIENDHDVYTGLQYIYDRNNIYHSKKSICVILAHELSLACCTTEKEALLSYIVKALNAASKHGQKEKYNIPMVYKLSLWLFPEGGTGYLSRDILLGCDNENISPKIISIRAFFCLGILELMRNVLNKKINPIADMDKYPALLDDLINYALDKETFMYFRNLVEIKLVEKKINEAYRKKNEQEVTCGLDKEVPAKDNGASELEENVSEASENDIIASESEKMIKIKALINKFEESRITAPNPAVIYCMLMEVLEASKESEILSRVEKMWEKLQSE